MYRYVLNILYVGYSTEWFEGASRESTISVLTLDTLKFLWHKKILQRYVELMAVGKVMPMKLLLHHLLHKSVNIIKNN